MQDGEGQYDMNSQLAQIIALFGDLPKELPKKERISWRLALDP
jgi:hypothetical protein